MDTFYVLSVTSVKSVGWVAHTEEGTCWVQTDDSGNSSVAHILSDVATNVGCNQAELIKCDVKTLITFLPPKLKPRIFVRAYVS